MTTNSGSFVCCNFSTVVAMATDFGSFIWCNYSVSDYLKDLKKDGDKVYLLHSVEMNQFLQTMHVTDRK